MVSACHPPHVVRMVVVPMRLSRGRGDLSETRQEPRGDLVETRLGLCGDQM